MTAGQQHLPNMTENFREMSYIEIYTHLKDYLEHQFLMNAIV